MNLVSIPPEPGRGGKAELVNLDAIAFLHPFKWDDGLEHTTIVFSAGAQLTLPATQAYVQAWIEAYMNPTWVRPDQQARIDGMHAQTEIRQKFFDEDRLS